MEEEKKRRRRRKTKKDEQEKPRDSLLVGTTMEDKGESCRERDKSGYGVRVWGIREMREDTGG